MVGARLDRFVFRAPAARAGHSPPHAPTPTGCANSTTRAGTSRSPNRHVLHTHARRQTRVSRAPTRTRAHPHTRARAHTHACTCTHTQTHNTYGGPGMVHRTCTLTPSLARNTGLEGHAAIDAPSHRASERLVSPPAHMHVRQALTTGLVVCLPCRLSCCRRTSISVMSSCDAMQDIISCNAEGGFYMDKDRILGAAGVAPTHCLAFTPGARPCPMAQLPGYYGGMFFDLACHFVTTAVVSMARVPFSLPSLFLRRIASCSCRSVAACAHPCLWARAECAGAGRGRYSLTAYLSDPASFIPQDVAFFYRHGM